MLSDKLADFLNAEPHMAYLGTVDGDGRPQIHRVFGVVADPATNTIDVVVPDVYVPPMTADGIAGARVALVASHMHTFETYQFKGPISAVRAGGEAEQTLQAALKKQLFDAAVHMGPDMQAFFTYHPAAPSTVLTMDVALVYGQTPREGTGNTVTDREQ